MNPAVDELYDVVEAIHRDFLNMFQPPVLHMGGDEVNFNCWNSSSIISSWLEEEGRGHQEEGQYSQPYCSGAISVSALFQT